MLGRRRGACAVFASLGFCSAVAPASVAQAQGACFVRLDTGTDMSGWRASATKHHGPGTGWSVEDGALTGRQTAGQQGGILLTDKSYGDVEVVFEVKIDWGCDSGFFFRTTAGDRAYQVNVDHLPESGVGTIYGESFAQELRAIPYFLTNMGNAAVAAPNQTPSFDLAQWPTIWNPTAFNEIRARVEGNPPRIQVWISGFKVMDFTDPMLRGEIDAQGPLAIQVHSGTRWIENGTVRYRNIRAKDLTVPCDEPEPGTGGGGGAAGAAGAAGGVGGGSSGAGGSSGGAAGATDGGAGTAAAGAAPMTPSAGAGGTPAGQAPATADEGGCGCRAAGSRRAWGWPVSFVALAFVLRRARRHGVS